MPGEVTQALVAAAEAAGRAPSIHNTQPWRWVVTGDRLELHADRRRQLDELDPAGRLLLISCGAALHHARVALSAEGWAYEVDRPATRPLARVLPTARTACDPVAMRRFQATLIRHTDRRPLSAEPMDRAALAALIAAAGAVGEQVHVLPPDQVVELAAAVERAMRAERTDERQRAELANWVGGERPEGTGIPDSAIPGQPPRTTVPARDFGVVGTLPVGPGHDKTAVYAVLYGSGDDDADWLRTGEALSEVWLEAVDRGVSVVPVSAPVEIASTRHLLRRILSGIGSPHLVLRLGVPDPDHAGPPQTPRLPRGQTIEVLDE